MVPPRFYVPEADATSPIVVLPDDEAVHLTRVLRLGTGDELRIFNGRGREWRAVIRDARKGQVTASLESEITPPPEPRTAITLGMAALKGDKMDDIVRDAVMLGAVAIQPIVTARAETSLAALARGHRLERWRRIAVSSAKQCGRAVIPEVRPPVPLDRAVAESPRLVMLTEPAATIPTRTLAEVPVLTELTMLVGPEGGWTPGELQRAAARGAILLTLGSLVLRADAAPLVALTALRVRWEDF